MNAHDEHTLPQTDQEQGPREEYGASGIEYVVLLRRPGTDWELHDGQVYPDPGAAQVALDDARAYLAQAPAALWTQLLATPDDQFVPLAQEYERLKGAEAALFARAVSAFVRAD